MKLIIHLQESLTKLRQWINKIAGSHCIPIENNAYYLDIIMWGCGWYKIIVYPLYKNPVLVYRDKFNGSG